MREDPADPTALSVLAKGAPERLAAARRATAAHPEDPAGWMMLASALGAGDPAARDEAYRRAIAAAPGSGAPLNDLAWSMYVEGRSGEALPLARAAVAIVPWKGTWSGAVLDTLGAILEDLGRCDEALAVERRADDALDPEARKREAGIAARLARLQAACGPHGAAPP